MIISHSGRCETTIAFEHACYVEGGNQAFDQTKPQANFSPICTDAIFAC